MDLFEFVSGIFHNMPQLQKSQHVLLNTGYILGLQPFRYDYRTDTLERLKPGFEMSRWKLMRILTSLMSLIIVMRVAYAIACKTVEYTSVKDMNRISIATINFMCLFLDLHSSWQLSDILALNNSVTSYFKKMKRKYFMVIRL